MRAFAESMHYPQLAENLLPVYLQFDKMDNASRIPDILSKVWIDRKAITQTFNLFKHLSLHRSIRYWALTQAVYNLSDPNTAASNLEATIDAGTYVTVIDNTDCGDAQPPDQSGVFSSDENDRARVDYRMTAQ